MQQTMSMIHAVDYFLPEQRVQTAEMIDEVHPEQYGVDNRLIEQKTGIHEVRHAQHAEYPSTLAIKACEKLFQRSDITPQEIDLIIFCGIDRDFAEPSTAHVIQAAIGSTATCFDVTNACLGFMTGIQIANNMIGSGAIRNALICTGERSSEVTKAAINELQKGVDQQNFRKKLGALTVGDAGAAAILCPADPGHGFEHLQFQSQGQLAKLCYYNWEDGQMQGQMVMDKICASMLKAHKGMYNQSLEQLNWQQPDIQCLITHQVGLRPWEKFSDIFAIDQKKMTKTFDFLGNITSATFPVNLARALEAEHIKPGDNIFAAMAGSGLSICQVGFRV